MNVDQKLEDLAEELRESRVRGNKADLEWVLEQAEILKKAKRLAARRFLRWLREQGHMEATTAERYMAVARMVDANSADRQKIATLSLVKTYVLAGLELATARGLLRGSIALSKPIEELSEIRFRSEIRRRFGHRRRGTRIRTVREVMKLINLAKRKLSLGHPRSLTAVQKEALASALADLRKMIGALPVAA